MYFKRQNIFFRTSKISALLLIIPLFFIQAFFNYDTVVSCRNGNSPVTVTRSTSALSISGIVKFNTNKPCSKKAAIRLNKRFQPETAPVIAIACLELPCYLPLVNSFGTYPDLFLRPAHLFRDRLRGPPEVV
jgi:hypothetical protein